MNFTILLVLFLAAVVGAVSAPVHISQQPSPVVAVVNDNVSKSGSASNVGVSPNLVVKEHRFAQMMRQIAASSAVSQSEAAVSKAESSVAVIAGAEAKGWDGHFGGPNTIAYTADDIVTVYVNGRSIGRWANWPWSFTANTVINHDDVVAAVAFNG